MQTIKPAITRKAVAGLVIITLATSLFYGCNSSAGNNAHYYQNQVPTLPVITVTKLPATTYQEFAASLQGTNDIEIRPQVDGYLDKIYVDEGAYVKKGQALFHINYRPYL
jgi:membrane fusion protein (multidrug efflux system)